jgi:hypothetical protein
MIPVDCDSCRLSAYCHPRQKAKHHREALFAFFAERDYRDCPFYEERSSRGVKGVVDYEQRRQA